MKKYKENPQSISCENTLKELKKRKKSVQTLILFNSGMDPKKLVGYINFWLHGEHKKGFYRLKAVESFFNTYIFAVDIIYILNEYYKKTFALAL